MAFRENYWWSAKSYSISLDHSGFPTVLIATTLTIFASNPHPSFIYKMISTIYTTPMINRGNTFQISTSLNRIALLIRYNNHQPTQHTTKGILELKNRIPQCFNLMLSPPRIMKYTSQTLGLTLPSYRWKATLFGHVVSKIPEAWQSVSTISRSKLRLHKHFPNTSKTIWAYREHCQHLSIWKWRDLNRWIFPNKPYNFQHSSLWIWNG
jgi:hypothetical protein